MILVRVAFEFNANEAKNEIGQIKCSSARVNI